MMLEKRRVLAPGKIKAFNLTIKSNNNGTGHSILNFGDSINDFAGHHMQSDDNGMRFRTNDTERMLVDSLRASFDWPRLLLKLKRGHGQEIW